jgi:hypothetical protein
MTRRGFLATLGSVSLGTLALVFSGRPKQWIYDFGTFFRPRLDPRSPRGTLSSGEMRSLVAFGEALVGGRLFSNDEKSHLSRHIDDRAKNTPGFFSLYRMTASLLDYLAESDFSTLPVESRIRILTRYELTSYDVRSREYVSPFRRQELKLRTLVVPDLIDGYYRSPAGWAVVGYESFPGRCGDLSRYTHSEV